MSRYLEEAADLLRKAVEANERQNISCPNALRLGREQIAKQFGELAAIDKGLVPAEVARQLLAQHAEDYR